MNISAEGSFLTLKAAALSDQGVVRPLNEDAVFERTVRAATGDIGLYLVCDGLGGHQAGEVASRLAVETVPAVLAEAIPPLSAAAVEGEVARLTDAQINQAIQEAILKANAKIGLYAESYQNESIRPGTTLTMALVYHQHVYIANVGDSRTYVWREGYMTQITKDHSLVAKLEEFGVIGRGEAAHHPSRNIISQALGTTKQLEIDLFKWKLRAGDKLLLCSDGFWQAFPEPDELPQLLDAGLSPAILCRQLVEEANRRDGSDNISLVIVTVNERP